MSKILFARWRALAGERKGSHAAGRKVLTLDRASLDEIVLEVQKYAEYAGLDGPAARRSAFLIDNALFHWLEAGGEGRELTVTFGRRLFSRLVTIEMEGPETSPFTASREDYGFGGSDVVISSGKRPGYAYEDGVNRLTLELRPEYNVLRAICIVAAAACAVGLLGNLLLPDALRESILSAVIDPVIETFFNLLRCIAGPMVFLSVTWGICGMGDSRLFGRVGRRVLLYSAGITALGALAGALCFPLLGAGLSSVSNADGSMSSLFEMILGIIPSSIVDPFLTGNTLQIIFLAIAVGISLITMSHRVGHLIHAVDQINLVVQHLMGVIGRLVPFLVFLLVTDMIWTGSLHLVSEMWRFFAVMLGVFVAVSLLIAAVAALRQRTGFRTVLRKNLPTLLVALTTASSAAAFSSNMEVSVKRFGIGEDLAGFSVPLGMVVHNPIAACYNVILVIFFAALYGVPCSIGWLVIGVVVSTVVAIASPPIPGGAAIVYALLFTQMGIPEEALAVVLVLDVITDFIVTAFECYVLPISMVNVAASLDLLDRDVLRKE